jgi:hypothetical protein
MAINNPHPEERVGIIVTLALMKSKVYGPITGK